MSAVSEWIVREYFEYHGFMVSQPRKYTPWKITKAEEESDLIVFNPRVREHRLPESPIWDGASLAGIRQAVIGVRGWHSERISATVIEKVPDFLRFAQPDAIRHAAARIGDENMARIICLPQLPATPQLKTQALDALKGRGIDGILTFRTMLVELVAGIDKNLNYEKSDLLQILRILKSYDLFKDDNQLELFPFRRARSRRVPRAAAE